MLFWTKKDLKDFLSYISLEEYYPLILKAFLRTPKELLDLAEEDLKERLRIKSFGHRKSFFKAIDLLKELNSYEIKGKTHFKEHELFERISSNNELQTLVKENKEIDDSWSSGFRESKTLESMNKNGEKTFEKER